MSDLCPMCVMFIADEEFNGCCSQGCNDDLLAYMDDLDDEYAHLTTASEL